MKPGIAGGIIVFAVGWGMTFSTDGFSQIMHHPQTRDSVPPAQAENQDQFILHPRPATTYYTRNSASLTSMKTRFVNLLPLTILGIDASAWQADNHSIVVYFKLRNNTNNPVSGFIEPSIGEESHGSASVAVSRLQPNSEFNGRVNITDPPPVCYDNFVQLSFFQVDTVGRKKDRRDDLRGPVRKGIYDISITQQSSDVSDLSAVTITTDRDQDFLDDKFEDFLLERFRPYFKFTNMDGPEEYRPCDVFNYIRNSTIGGNYESAAGSTDNCPPLSGFEQSLLANPGNLLNAGAPGRNPADLWAQHERTILHLQPSEAARHGSPWDEVLATKNTGLYGHVVPVVLNTPGAYQRGAIFPCPNSPQSKLYFKVEYWQFFGYNYAHQHIGRDYADHEGDWATIQLLIESGTLRIVSVFHYAHGGETRFDLDPSMQPVFFRDMGGLPVVQYNGVNISQPSNQDIASDGAGYATRNNRRVRFYQEPGTTEYTHPVVYIENGSHEFWPTEDGVYGSTQLGNRYFAPLHNGDDFYHSYLAATPPNLGELEHPLDETPEANVILRYSGLWGCYNVYNSNPPGPTLHTEWTYPFNSAIFNDIVFALEN